MSCEELILQAFSHFTYVTAHSDSPSFASLHLRHSSFWFSKPAHSPSFQSLHLRHSSFWFSKLSVTAPTSQLILQPFPRFTYVTTHYPTLPLLHLRHSSFSNPSFVTGFSLMSPGEPPMDFRISDLVKTLIELIFNPCSEFRWSREGPVSHIHSPHLHGGAPGIFWDLLRFVYLYIWWFRARQHLRSLAP